MKFRDWDNNLKYRLYMEFANGFLYWMFFPYMTRFFTGYYGELATGILLLGLKTFEAVAVLMGGYLADRYGRKKMMQIASVLRILTFAFYMICFFPLFHELPLFAVFAYATTGLFSAFYNSASRAMVADLIAPADRPAVFSTFYVIANITIVVGPLIGGVLFFQYPFYIMLAAFIISVIMYFIITTQFHETVHHQVQKLLLKDVPGWFTTLHKQFASYMTIYRDRIFGLFAIAWILLSITASQFSSMLSIYADSTISIFGFAIDKYSIIIAINGIMISLFGILLQRLMIRLRFSNKTIFAIGAGAYSVSMLLFGIDSSMLFLALGMIVLTFGEIILVAPNSTFIVEIAPENQRAQYLAAADFPNTCARIIAPLFISFVGVIGFRLSFIILAIFSAIAAFIFWHMFHLYAVRKAKQ